MATWLYQINQQLWPPEWYRIRIWEGERWYWPVGQIRGSKGTGDPEPGDTVVFFYARTGGRDYGFYGWAVLLEWRNWDGEKGMYFRPVAPSDWLKMDPWRDEDALRLADEIRGPVKQGTLWSVPDELVDQLRSGIVRWLSYAGLRGSRGGAGR